MGRLHAPSQNTDPVRHSALRNTMVPAPPFLEAPFWGFMGAAFALVFSNMGAAYGTDKSGIGISTLGVAEPDKIMKSIVPVVMAGVLGIYGLIIAVIIANSIEPLHQNKPTYNY